MDPDGRTEVGTPREKRRWNEDWNSSTWASARGLWKRPSPEEEEEDHRLWCAAASESGGIIGVLWCEVCQLLADLLPRGIRARLTRIPRKPGKPRMPRMPRISRLSRRAAPEVLPAPAPEQAEG